MVIMGIVQVTHWRLDYIMNEVSIGALLMLFGANEDKKPKGMLAQLNLDDAALANMGLKVKDKKG